MKVKVKCFSTLSDDENCSYDQSSRYALPEEAATAGNLAERIPISKEDISLIFVNGKRAAFNTALSEGDRVAFVPPTGGM